MIMRLPAYLVGQKRRMVGVMVTMLAGTLVQALNPWPLKLVVDKRTRGPEVVAHSFGFAFALRLAFGCTP
jgi:ABC-type multidrug transport system fused ATPase/permease subunit